MGILLRRNKGASQEIGFESARIRRTLAGWRKDRDTLGDGKGRPSRSLNVLLCALRDGTLPIHYLERLQEPALHVDPESAADHEEPWR